MWQNTIDIIFKFIFCLRSLWLRRGTFWSRLASASIGERRRRKERCRCGLEWVFCFWGWDLNNISPNRQCFQIRFFPGNNVFNNSPSNPTIEQADTTGGKHLLVEKTSHYAFSSTSSFLTYTFCTISISRHSSKLVNDPVKKRTNVTLVKSKLRIPKIQCLF